VSGGLFVGGIGDFGLIELEHATVRLATETKHGLPKIH
jgi:hypothetical protein